MRRICVFCGSNVGAKTEYADAAREVGALLARQGIGLVYGGGHVGLMGALADAVLAEGGDVIGVIPEGLVRKEVGHKGLPDLRVVGSMHERKALMADLSDGFIALPGGAGTFDELFEIVTWAQLGIHRKPVGLLNTAGYYDLLLAMLDRAVEEQFIRPAHREMILVSREPAALLQSMKEHTPSAEEKWVGRGEG